MQKVTEMNREIFQNNLLMSIKEIKEDIEINKTKFKIVPKCENNKSLNAIDNQMRLIALSDKNIGNRLLTFEETVKLLSCNSPLVPIWVNVKYSGIDEQMSVFELETSLRMRKPSLLRNVETGHPPFKSIIN